MPVMNSKELKASIKSIGTNAAKLREAIQEALVSCAYYSMKDGNTEAFNQLLQAVGSATRIKGLTAWAEQFAPVLIKEGRFTLNKTAMKNIVVTNEEDFAEYEAEMRQVNWWETVQPEKAESIFDVTKYLDRVMKHLAENGAIELKGCIEAAVAKFNHDKQVA